MICAEVRFALGTEPFAMTKSLEAHLRGCGACAAYRREVIELEESLRAALNIPIHSAILQRVRIEHIALWTPDLDRCRRFYVEYFGAVAGTGYRNPTKGFESVFLTFDDGARLEIMTTTSLAPIALEPGAQRMGLTHLAIAVGSEEQVDALTRRLRVDGYPVLDGPRRTGDGYYESVVLDPDGNRIEITA